MTFLSEFLNFSFSAFPYFVLSLLILFSFLCLEQFYSFPCSFFLVFLYFLEDLFIYSLRVSIIFTQTVLRSLSDASDMVEYLGPSVVGLLGSSEDILSCMLLTVLLHWNLDIWDWVIICLDGDTWFCFCWVRVLFLGFCFLSRFWETVMALCCLIGYFLWTCSPGLFI